MRGGCDLVGATLRPTSQERTDGVARRITIEPCRTSSTLCPSRIATVSGVQGDEEMDTSLFGNRRCSFAPQRLRHRNVTVQGLQLVEKRGHTFATTIRANRSGEIYQDIDLLKLAGLCDGQ